ncbi:MAG: CDP-diacylglycerol--serine O-phosphatidyltransferase [Muribaculaceae bacterium]|nr:CDP-diacylglycerol--serine O-phosphatidyltransferase [Muribaculaceae bacterium]MBO5187533.1 CDP-diacylglycerol--serine O-phosphatidyltransferase [Prevotella sp.]
MKSITSNIPNTITCLNLLSGCIAIIMAFHGLEPVGQLMGWEWCCIFIGAAAIFDFLDGAVARLLKAYSDIGKELDSLSDLVSFGVAPGLMMYNIMQSHCPNCWVNYLALFIPVCGALRLARFNVMDAGMTTFRGLPIPAAAIFWIGMAGWINSYTYPQPLIMAILLVIISLAMVSRIPMFSLKFKNLDLRENFRRYVIILAAISFVILYGLSGLLWTIAFYLLLSMLTRDPHRNA